MYLSGRHELFVLFGTFAGGLILGLVLDFFRILRKNFKAASAMVWLQDIIMWAVMLAVVYTVIFITDDGSIRWYQFLGFGAGATIYMLLLSRFVIAVSSAVISFFKLVFMWVFKVVAFPFVLIYRYVLNPFVAFFKWLCKKLLDTLDRQKKNFFRFLRLFKKI